MSKFTPSPAEAALVSQILAQADPQKLGVITGEAAVKIFSGSKLSPTVLAEIWSLADDENNGVLTRKGIAVAVRLLGHAQRGERVSDALVNKPGPIPTIEGLTPPATQPNVAIPSTKSPPPGLPPLTAQDKAKFLKLFMGCNPTNGIISGDKARDVFVRSKLPVDKLSQIWTLADTKSRGSLDVTDFTIAMYLIQATMSGQLHAIPLSLPPALYEQAGGGVVAHATGGSGSFSPSLSGVFPNRPMSTIEPQFTGQNLAALQPQMTGQLRSAPSLPPRSAVGSSMSSFPFLQQQATGTASHWDVTAAEKASADRLFDGLDTQKKGYIEGDVAVPFMLQSGLPEDVLAQVWDLADLNNDGRLTRDGFAVAMHLIQRKLTGKDIPASLPPTLIPPSMRAAGAGSVAPSQPAVPEPIRDLLWDDSPPASATAPTHPPPTFSPQVTGSISPRPTPVLSSPPQRAQSVTFADTFTGSPFNVTAPAVVHRDLLGDDEEPAASSPPLHDQSAEIGNVKNQLSSTTRSLEASTSERASLERQLAEQAAQLSALQTQLSSAKAAYETETRLLATLRERFVAQTVDIQKAREELIRGESDLSAVRMEKSETEGSLLRDKEEVRELNRKMAEVGTQVEALKVDVEKAKKEAKQQKGLLAIAKKQLATRESERAKVEKELEEASIELQNAAKEREDAEAELTKEVPATRTNGPERAMSPASEILAYAAMQPLPASPEASTPTSIISKSTNPFERLAMSSGSPPRSQSPFLPFSPVLSTSPIVPPAAAEPQAEVQEGPFGFSQAFGISHEELVTAALPAEFETPKAVAQLTLSPQVPPAQTTSATSEPEVSPTDTDVFTTPPTTASAPTHTITAEEPAVAIDRFPALGEAAAVVSAPVSQAAVATTVPESKEEHAESTDLDHQLKEIDVEESDSSDEEDNEPLTAIKAKLDTGEKTLNGKAEPSSVQAVSAAVDPFAASQSLSAVQSVPSTPAAGQSSTAPDISATVAPKEPVPVSAVSATPAADTSPKVNGTVSSAQASVPVSAPATVNDFDEAMGNLSASSGAPSQLSQFTFDSAFEDNFDFAAATAATHPQPTQPTTNGVFGSALPAPPAAAPNGFDNVFMTQPTSSTAVPAPVAPAVPVFPAPPPASETKPFSFDDAFGSGAGSAPPAGQPSSSSGPPLGISFDDAFGGANNALSLDTFGAPGHQPPPGSPPAKVTAAPFPTTGSTPSSPHGRNSPQSFRRSISPPHRHTSPPPRHSSPKPRPSTSSSDKEKPPTRHSKLSIRLPFGRKKKHDAPPLPPPLSQQQLVEEPTPAVEDDVESVKTLCGMGFSRTQAVAALEEHGYDVQRALNSLLGAH